MIDQITNIVHHFHNCVPIDAPLPDDAFFVDFKIASDLQFDDTRFVVLAAEDDGGLIVVHATIRLNYYDDTETLLMITHTFDCTTIRLLDNTVDPSSMSNPFEVIRT